MIIIQVRIFMATIQRIFLLHRSISQFYECLDVDNDFDRCMPLLHGTGIGISTIRFFGNSFSHGFIHSFDQKTKLIKNIEKLAFWAGDNQKLQFAKQELISQINNLDISISGKGFFTVNRQFMTRVRLTLLIHLI